MKCPESPGHGGSQISLVEFPAQTGEYRIWKITANRSGHYQSYVYPGKVPVHPALKHTSQVASKCKLLCIYQTSLRSSASSSCLCVTELRLQVKPPRPGRLHTPSKFREASQRLRNLPRKKNKWIGMQRPEILLIYSPCSPTVLQRLYLQFCSVRQEGLAM